jgi:hypothetical protein
MISDIDASRKDSGTSLTGWYRASVFILSCDIVVGAVTSFPENALTCLANRFRLYVVMNLFLNNIVFDVAEEMFCNLYMHEDDDGISSCHFVLKFFKN